MLAKEELILVIFLISLKCWLRHCVCVSAMFSHWLAAKAQTLSMNQSCCAVTSISPPHAVLVLTSSSEGVLCGCNRVRCACEVLGRSSFVFLGARYFDVCRICFLHLQLLTCCAGGRQEVQEKTRRTKARGCFSLIASSSRGRWKTVEEVGPSPHSLLNPLVALSTSVNSVRNSSLTRNPCVINSNGRHFVILIYFRHFPRPGD